MMAGLASRLKEMASDDYEAAKYFGAAMAYRSHYRGWFEGCELKDIEKKLESPLCDMDSGFETVFSVTGYIDKLVVKDGRCILMDHKTTSEDLSNPNSRYRHRLAYDPQSTQYLMLSDSDGLQVDEICWDVFQKPDLRPAKSVPKKKWEEVKDGSWAGRKLPNTGRPWGELLPDTGEKYANGDKKRCESPTLFAHRVFYWCLDNADKVFLRYSLMRDEEDVRDYNRSVVELSNQLLRCEEANVWPQNFRSCHAFRRDCDYLDVCHGGADLDSNLFVDSSADWYRLSHSSMGCYYECPRKFYNRYVLRRKPLHEDDVESLRVGSMWHMAMDHVFNELTGGDHE